MTNALDLIEEPIDRAPDLAKISIAFAVDRVFDVADGGDTVGGFILSERRLGVPYIKDYDVVEGDSPTQWGKRFDLSNWGLIGAHRNGTRVGGATIAFNTESVRMLEGRKDLAVLWDIRVAPPSRGQGVGTALFQAAERWAVARGCGQLKVETQSINVPACRFYSRQGCELRGIDRSAYPDLPDEIQLLWYKDLTNPLAG